MNYGQIKEQFAFVNNNLAVPDDQIPLYIMRGLARIQRDLKLPFMLQVNVTIAGDDFGYVAKPSDFLRLHEILVNGLPLSRVGLARFFKLDAGHGIKPEYWTDLREKILITPKPAAGSEVVLIYYAAMPAPVLDTDENEIMQLVPDLLIYAALVEAATDMLADDAIRQLWEQRYGERANDLQLQADEEAYEGQMTVEAPSCDY
ncbi:phage adaptor protein [Roseomonas chloroacetimidivorans]|uniref:phage adaptor protein n=1 Tax=Roseomonas chloroacetimidivorans TaxID=1766656 RepID=UPI003C76912B